MKYAFLLFVFIACHMTMAQTRDKCAENASGVNLIITSDLNKKENFAKADGKELLTKLKQLPISRWNYKNETPAITHIGPTAQDFYKIFGLGSDEKTISTVDPAGISLATIQELARQLEELRSLVNYQQAAMGLLKAENSELKASLEGRIKKLEAHVDMKTQK